MSVPNKTTSKPNFIVICLILLLAVLFKIIPHLPNFSPELVFAAYFGARFKKLPQMLLIIAMLLLCDLFYSLASPYAVFGTWTLYTYSGFLLIRLLASSLAINPQRWHFIGFSLSGACIFWLWTNAGTWIASGIYPNTSAGLMACYIAALPFLPYSLLSALTWSVIVKLAAGSRLLTSGNEKSNKANIASVVR